MKKMLNKRWFQFPAALVVITTTCALKLTPSNAPEDYTTELIRAYNTLAIYTQHANVFTLQEVSSDELVLPTRGGDWFDGGVYIKLHQHTYDPTDFPVNNVWQSLYNGIVHCNRQLFQYSKITEPGTEVYQAELRVLRAFYYFLLLDLFRNVPLVTEYFPSSPQLPASTAGADLWAFIVSEIDASIIDLPAAPVYGRFNQSAAEALKAKLYLNKGVYTGSADWTQTLTLCNSIISAPYYNLEANYFDNFSPTNNASPEIILQIPYDATSLPGFNIAHMTLHYQSQATFNLSQQPWNGYAAVEDFYNSYASNDVRKEGFLVGVQRDTINQVPITDPGVEPGDPDGPEINFTPNINSITNAWRQAGARIMKWQYQLGATESLNNDFALFRLADIILMRAEAQLHLGNEPSALADINMVRVRAGLSPLGTVTFDDILAERGRELFAENWRRQDLIRFGKYNDAWWEKGISASFRNIFPVPIQQLNANPNLTQNPGY